MKIFKHIPKDNYDYLNLQDDIKKTGEDCRSFTIILQNVVDLDLIDYYIYQAKAVSMRYKFLLNCAKKIRGFLCKESPMSIVYTIFIKLGPSICNSRINLLGIFHDGP